MLVLLCALINIVSSTEQLHEAVKHSKNSFYALATQTGQNKTNADNFIAYVLSNPYAIYQWKNLAESYLKYMNGERFESMWDGSDWWSNQACQEHTHGVCEHTETKTTKYFGPKPKI